MKTRLVVNEKCPVCGVAAMPADAESDDAFDCPGCGVRLNVVVAIWADPMRAWLEREEQRRRRGL